MNRGQLQQTPLAPNGGLMLSVNSIDREILIFRNEFHPSLASAKKPFPIEPEVQRLIQGTCLVHCCSRPKRAGLNDVVREQKIQSPVILPDVRTECDTLLLVDVYAVAENHFGLVGV